MAGHAAGIGDNGNGFLHGRYPVRRGHGGDEDFAVLEFIDVFRICNNVALACCHPRACRKSFDQYFMISCHFHFFITCFLFFILLGPYGFRTGLENPDAVLVVYSPFHIHVAAIVFFNGLCVGGEFYDLVIGKRLCFGTFFRYLSFFYIAAGFTDKFNGLFVDNAGFDGKVRFIDDEVIRGDSPLYHVFPKAPGTFNHDAGIIAVGNVHGKHDAGHLGVSHHLDSCGKGYIFMVEMFLCSVVHSTVGECGSVAFLHLADNHVTAGDIQVGILLACKGSIRQVFCGSGRTDSHIGILFIDFLSQFFICITDSLGQVSRHFSRYNAFTNLCADFMKFYGIFNILQILEQFMNLFVLSCGFHEIAVSMGSGCIAIGNRDPGGSGQFTKGRRFAPNQSYIFPVQFIKP